MKVQNKRGFVNIILPIFPTIYYFNEKNIAEGQKILKKVLQLFLKCGIIMQ